MRLSQESIAEAARYWNTQRVMCRRARLDPALAETDMAQVWEQIGMPDQDWWQFRFIIPKSDSAPDLMFGMIGSWQLLYRTTNTGCLALDQNDAEHYANSSFFAFFKMLILFDQTYRQIQRQCPGDFGEDWNRGDIIIQQMEFAMHSADPQAFASSSNLWPRLLIEIDG